MYFIDKTLIKNSVILAVDDSIVLLDALDISIGSLCKEFLVATSAVQAIDIITKYSPDLVLLDIEMPAVNGFELFEKLKELTTISRIPVIFLTGSDNRRTEARALEMGAVDYITKPFDRTVLLHRINTHLNISNYNTRMEKSMMSIENGLINTFSSLLESKDKNANGHAVRTSLYMDILGKELIDSNIYSYDLNDALLRGMVRAAPLHDIGKIDIPDSVLLKPGLLTEPEFEIMKTHTVKGAAVLNDLYKKMPSQHYLMFAEQIALSHHEHFDGSGYPNKLAGSEIPLSARIMAIADVYDALTKGRAYRGALSHDQACKIIVNEKGSHFDPVLVDEFEKVTDKFKAVSERDDFEDSKCA
jgi:putative two-component system response regulator